MARRDATFLLPRATSSKHWRLAKRFLTHTVKILDYHVIIERIKAIYEFLRLGVMHTLSFFLACPSKLCRLRYCARFEFHSLPDWIPAFYVWKFTVTRVLPLLRSQPKVYNVCDSETKEKVSKKWKCLYCFSVHRNLSKNVSMPWHSVMMCSSKGTLLVVWISSVIERQTQISDVGGQLCLTMSVLYIFSFSRIHVFLIF